MAFQLQIFLFCASLLVVTVVARPQTWNIGFQPNNTRNPTSTEAVPDPSGSSPATTAAPVTTPSPAYLACLAQCPATSEYNPICGSDSLNYHNLGRFNCAVRCGADVTMVRMGTCLSLG